MGWGMDGYLEKKQMIDLICTYQTKYFDQIKKTAAYMLLKPAVLKGSLATGFGVGAGPGVPGEPEKPKHVNWRSLGDSQKIV